MPNLATWIRPKDEKWFQTFFVRHPDVHVCDARKDDFSMDQMDGLLLTGGSDIAPEFLRQEIVNPTLIDKDVDPVRDHWEFEAISKSLARGLPILGICKGMQILNVALGGTLKLDIPGHKYADQKDQDIQPLRHDTTAHHRFERVNSSHHQAVELLTGGSDIAPEFLRQEIVNPTLIDKDVDPVRDRWEFEAISTSLARGLPILGICKGIQTLNVALGGTLKLDIPGHKHPDQKDQDIQPLRHDTTADHRFERVNSSHHQAVDQIADGFEVEAWCATDDVIEQMRLRNYPFALAVQYHPERGKIYDALFGDFFARLNGR